ncbi:MAG: tryptophan-rich sensory protein [Saprospiraceae bacterium]|nr:tryptophan-rich sensory protein [Saprospiraceae bacterium]
MIIRWLWPKILIAVVTCLLIGYLGSFATIVALEEWYPTLVKPSFNPPNSIFGPVWTILYILMGLAVALIWHSGWEKEKVKNAILVFIFQLVLNGFWSMIFFGMHSIGGALFIIVVLWILILLCIIRFYPINKFASFLMIPYLLWVSFATILNASIYYLNS